MRVVILLGGLLCSCGFMNSESRKLPWIHTDAVVVKSQADYAALKRAKDIDVIYKFNFQEGVYLAKNVHSGKNHDFPKLEGFSLAGGKARVWHSLARASLVQDRDLVPPIEGLDGLSYWKTALSLSDKELGRGVKVCVIDNGIHGSVSQGQVNDINLTWGKQPPQSGSHGSVIASIYLSGQENQGDKEKVEFYSIRISFEGEKESTYNTDLGMYQVAAALDSAIGVGCHVVNTSFVYHQGDVPAEVERVERAVLREMERRGMILVTAAGNYGKNLSYTDYLPARGDYANIVTVGSHNSRGEISCYSNYGRGVDITASGDLHWGSGTSFSTAVVGSATAKAFLLDREISWKKVLGSLYRSASKYYFAQESSCHREKETAPRHGRLDAKKMFRFVLGKQ